MQLKDEIVYKKIADTMIRNFGLDYPALFDCQFEITDEAKADVTDGLSNRIAKIIKPAFCRYFFQYLNEVDVLDDYIVDSEDDAIDPHRDAFVEKISADENAFIRTTLPTLTERIKHTGTIYYEVVSEMYLRLSSCYEEICENLLNGGHFTKVTAITADTGDSHNNGHTTSIITTDAGKVVYKPHDVRIDLKSYELINTFFSDIMKAPKVCCYDDFGFVEFMENSISTTDEAAKRYFYNLGGFVSVVQMLGSTDLHHNNIIANDGKPVVIDYELMITPGYRKPDKSLSNDFRYSVYFSNLMPSRRGDVELSILFARDEENKSAPVVDGSRKAIMDYPDEFFAGLRDVYHRCMEHKDEIKDFILSMKGLYVRHIFRGTRVYADLMEKTLESAWVEDPNVRDSVFEALSVAMKRNGSDKADDLTNAETDAIMRGDIPYIYMKTDSCDLYADGRDVYKDFFALSCIDNILSRIDYLSESDLEFEERLLRKAMTRALVHKKKQPPEEPTITGSKEISNEVLLAEADKIFVDIADDAITTPSGRMCWFGPNYFLETGMNILGTGLIDGITGLTLYFSMVYRFSKDESIRARAKQLVENFTNSTEKWADGLDTLEIIYPNVENTGMSTGLTGKLMAYRIIGKNMAAGQLIDDADADSNADKVADRYKTLCSKMIRQIAKMDLSYEKVDIFSGIAGLLKALCKYDDFYNEPGVPETVNRLADKLISMAGIPYKGTYIWKTLTPEWPISGSGHGQAGIASALLLAGKRLGRADLIKAAYSTFDFEKNTYSSALKAWPDRRSAEKTENYLSGYCSGAAGIGINALEALGLLDEGNSIVDINTAAPGTENYKETLRQAMESVHAQPLIYKDFLCCGNSAMVEFLLQAGRALQDDDLIAEARTRMAAVMERAAKQGHYNCINHSLNNIFSANLFYGVAGIGYEMYRLIYPEETESILL